MAKAKKKKAVKKPPKRTSKTNPNTPAPPPGIPRSKRQAALCIQKHLNGYVYELQRNGASSDFIKTVQSESTWALNELSAEPPAPPPPTDDKSD